MKPKRPFPSGRTANRAIRWSSSTMHAAWRRARGTPGRDMLAAGVRRGAIGTEHPSIPTSRPLPAPSVGATAQATRQADIGPPRRVAQVFHDDRYGGPAKRVCSASGKLLREGYRDVLFFPPWGGNGPQIAARLGLEVRTVKIHKAAHPRRILAFARWVVGLPVDILRFHKAYRQADIDLVVVNAPFNVAPAIAAWLSGLPLVWYLNDTLLPRRAAALYGSLMALLASRVVAQGQALAAHYGLRPDQYDCIYSHVDTDIFSPGPALVEDGTTGTVGILANWSWMKGYDHFIEACAQVRRRWRGRLSIIMAGARLATQEQYCGKVDDLIERHDLTGDIQELGFVNTPQDLIRRFTILVMASRTGDACPNVVLEAMASGVPVVATAVGCVQELIEQDREIGPAGIVVPAGEPDRLADAIFRILDDPRLARTMAANGRLRALRYFNTQAYIDRHVALFNAMLRPSRCERNR